MRIPNFSDRRVLIVPGLHGSGPEHWQSRWQQRFPNFCRVEQADWSVPDLERWAERVGEALSRSDQPTWIVAHSFGCLASLHHMRTNPSNLAGALLVAPADPHKFGVANVVRDVRTLCPSILVGSLNDPWMTNEHAEGWARIWGCDYINAGALGHINADSGLGDWQSGLDLLFCLLQGRVDDTSIKVPTCPLNNSVQVTFAPAAHGVIRRRNGRETERQVEAFFVGERLSSR